jgi:hypothetical protein
LGSGEEFSFQKETGEKVPVTVKAFKSTDEGVAFLIEAEGKVLYHAGDLNNWVWEGEPEEYNFRMSEAFHSELLKIAGNHTTKNLRLFVWLDEAGADNDAEQGATFKGTVNVEVKGAKTITGEATQ